MAIDDRPASATGTGKRLTHLIIVTVAILIALAASLAIRLPDARQGSEASIDTTSRIALSSSHNEHSHKGSHTLTTGSIPGLHHVRHSKPLIVATTHGNGGLDPHAVHHPVSQTGRAFVRGKSHAKLTAVSASFEHAHKRAVALTSCAPKRARAVPSFVYPSPHGTPITQERALLSLTVNGVDEGETLVISHSHTWWIALSELKRAGLLGTSAPSVLFDGKAYVALPALAPGITYQLDERQLSLALTAAPEYFSRTVIDMGQNRPPQIVFGSTSSAFFNYAFDWQNFKSLGEFSEIGLSSHGALYYSGFGFQPGGSFVRGLTNATFDNPARMKRWVIGDSFAEGGVLGGGTFLGGVSVSRNFSLNPYFVRYPGVHLSGQALTPSTAEIYVNGHLVGTRLLPPGAFDINNLPVVAGGGTTQVIVRDAFGRTQTLTSSYYFANTVLERGLSEYSYGLGAQRANVGSASNDYGKLVFVGFDRVGLTDWVTAGARLEGAAGLVSLGPTTTFRLGHGQLGFNAALSSDGGLGGSAVETDYSYQNSFLNYGFGFTSFSPNYSTVSLSPANDRPLTLGTAFISSALGPRASATITYTAGHWRDSGSRQEAAFSGSVRLSNFFDLVATASHSHDITSSNQYTLSLSYQIGRTTLAAVSQQGGSVGAGNAVSVQQSLPLGTGVGYRFEHGNGSQITNDDLAQVQTSYGLYQAAYLRNGAFEQKDILASGAVVDAGDGLMLTRAVEDGYAIIDLPGLRGVRGYFNNQEIGRTDGRGRLLIPNLISYYGNRVEIADQDIPLNYSVDGTEQTVAPPYRGGSLVRFPVKREVAVMGKVLVDDANQQKVPAFGQLRVVLAGREAQSELDGNGTFYLEDIQPGRYRGRVEYADGSCALELVIPHQQSSVTELGSVHCTPARVGDAKSQEVSQF